MRTLLLSLILAGCASGATTSRERQGEAALDRELAGRVAGSPQSCIAWRSTRFLQATGDGRLLYRDGETIWVNQPVVECRGLEPTDALVVEMRGGSRYCRGDQVRAIESGAAVAGPRCVLGEFTPYRRPS
jgi:hypothetical protein